MRSISNFDLEMVGGGCNECGGDRAMQSGCQRGNTSQSSYRGPGVSGETIGGAFGGGLGTWGGAALGLGSGGTAALGIVGGLAGAAIGNGTVTNGVSANIATYGGSTTTLAMSGVYG